MAPAGGFDLVHGVHEMTSKRFRLWGGRSLVATAGLLCVAGSIAVLTNAVLANTGFVAGVEPSRRPADAPAISSVQHPAGWQAAALRGVSDPKPASLKFLDDQGAWYTPFTHPGMPGRYDIRGLHADAKRKH